MDNSEVNLSIEKDKGMFFCSKSQKPLSSKIKNKKRIKASFVTLALLAILALGGLISQRFIKDTSAASDYASCVSESGAPSVASIQNACYNVYYVDPVSTGALWINGSTAKNSDVVNGTVSNGKITAYVHGQTFMYQGPGSSTAYHIDIRCGGSTCSFVEGLSGNLDRGSTGTTATWTSGGYKSFTIDFNKFKQVASYNSSTGNYEYTVSIYRCFSETIDSYSCYGDPSTIKAHVSIPVTFASTASITSVTNATRQSTTSASNYALYTLPKERLSTTITFNHTISSTPSGYANLASYSSTNTNIDGTATSRTASGSNISPAFNLDIPNGQSKNICNTAYFSPTSGVVTGSSLSSRSGSSYSSKCATIYRETEAEYYTSTSISSPNYWPSKSPTQQKDVQSNNSTSIGDNPKIYADSTTSNPLSISFKHTIFRKDNTYDNGVDIAANWNITGNVSKITSSGTAHVSKNSSETVSNHNYIVGNAESDGNYNETIALGTYDKQICQTISASKTILVNYPGNNNFSPSATKETSGACAHLYRPYNFNLKIRLEDVPSVIYPNEPISVQATVTNQDNRDQGDSRQEGTHSATPSDTEIKIFAVVIPADNAPKSEDTYKAQYGLTDLNAYLNSLGGTIEDLGTQKGAINVNGASYGISYNLHDVTGSKICYVAAVNYTNSGYSTPRNGLIGYGDIEKRYITSPVTCQTAAKKATFQVWGGSVFGNGSMSATYSVIDSQGKILGSWVDYGITSNSSISRIASAAGLEGGTTKTPSSNDTILSKMTISNTGVVLGNAKLIHSSSTKDQLLSVYGNAAKNTPELTSSDNINVSSSYQESNSLGPNDEKHGFTYRFTNIGKGSSGISSSDDLLPGITHIIYAKGDIDIKSNFTYYNGPYVNAFYIPQYVIISEGNITIDQSVTNLDAVLISSEEINTCTQSTNEADLSIRETCQNNPLQIRGPIFARRLNLTRSYSTDNEPAEKIIKSAANEFWASAQSENSPRSVTTYLRELAPRY